MKTTKIEWTQSTWNPIGGCRRKSSGCANCYAERLMKVKAGDRLWVRETWADVNTENGPGIAYRAGGIHFCVDDAYPVEYERYPGMKFSMWCGDLFRGEEGHSWRSSMFMPRWASRILLEATDDARREPLQAISEADSQAEGVERLELSVREADFGSGPVHVHPLTSSYVEAYATLWDQINGPGSWDANPDATVISFRRIG